MKLKHLSGERNQKTKKLFMKNNSYTTGNKCVLKMCVKICIFFPEKYFENIILIAVCEFSNRNQLL